MPFYEYTCGACGKEFTLLQSITAKAEDTICPYCKQKKTKKKFRNFHQQAEENLAVEQDFPRAEADEGNVSRRERLMNHNDSMPGHRLLFVPASRFSKQSRRIKIDTHNLL
jgi:putative FmdB family regulatory protein